MVPTGLSTYPFFCPILLSYIYILHCARMHTVAYVWDHVKNFQRTFTLVHFWKLVHLLILEYSSYILRRPQSFAKSSPYFWQQYIQSKVRWRFCKNLWPSQNIWTLKDVDFSKGSAKVRQRVFRWSRFKTLLPYTHTQQCISNLTDALFYSFRISLCLKRCFYFISKAVTKNQPTY